MTEAIPPRHRRPRLAWIELPRMQVEHHGLLFPGVHALHAPTHERERREPEEAAAANGKIHAENPRRADGELDEAGRSVSPNLVREPWSVRIAVPVVEDRVLARVVPETLLEQDLMRPRLRAADREVGRAVPDDRVADEILEGRFGPADVGAELLWSQTVHVLV